VYSERPRGGFTIAVAIARRGSVEAGRIADCREGGRFAAERCVVAVVVVVVVAVAVAVLACVVGIG
jgi:hypothetical protein